MVRPSSGLSARLYLLVALSTLALLLVIGAAVTGTAVMATAGRDLYERGVLGVEHASRLSLLFERQRGLVGRTPAETDLARQKAYRAGFNELSAAQASQLGRLRDLLPADAQEHIGRIADLLGKLHSDADAVFDYSGNFLQDQATEALDGAFAATERQLDKALTDLLDAMKRGADADVAALTRARNATVAGVVAVSLLGVLLVDGLGLLLARRLSRRLRHLTSAMTALAQGALDTGIAGTADRDEIGAMARALQVFKDSMLRANRLAAEQNAERMAKERRQAAMDQHTQDFGASVSGVLASLASSAVEMRRVSTAMAGSATRVREQATGTAANAARSSEDLSSVALAVEQLTETTAEIARQVDEAAQLARTSVGHAEACRRTMADLAGSTSSIGEVMCMIGEIAAQTNLLAPYSNEVL
jgi:methyl-accepting chemotaxis protein